MIIERISKVVPPLFPHFLPALCSFAVSTYPVLCGYQQYFNSVIRSHVISNARKTQQDLVQLFLLCELFNFRL